MDVDMEIDTIAEWDAICRICLQEGQLHSLFDYDDDKTDLNISEKIMLCSPIVVSVKCNKSTLFILMIQIWNIFNVINESIGLLLFVLFVHTRYQSTVNYPSKFVRSVYVIYKLHINFAKTVNDRIQFYSVF